MFAYGAGSVLCSIFSGYIPAASVARSAIQDGAGGKTQVRVFSVQCSRVQCSVFTCSVFSVPLRITHSHVTAAISETGILLHLINTANNSFKTERTMLIHGACHYSSLHCSSRHVLHSFIKYKQ